MTMRSGAPRPHALKILEVTNVDFSMRQFLLPLMRALREEGHDVVGACADGPDLDVVRAEGFVVRAMPLVRSFSPLAQARAFLALRRLIKRERPDIVHAHMPISGLLARLAAWHSGVPVVAYTCHGFLFNQPGKLTRRVLARCLEWLAGRITDVYMTVSDEEAADARRLGIHPGPVSVGNGRDPAQFQPDPVARQAVRAELGVSPERIVVLAVSRLVRHKGYPELLRAMESVPNAELWVVGSRLTSDHGDDMGMSFAHAEVVLGDRLKRLGHRADVARIMAAADIFVLPSHFEGLPMSVIEAMLSGLPVVATDIRGPREQVVDGETGLLVTPGLAAPLARALQRLANNAVLRAKMGVAGRARACALYDERAVTARIVRLLTSPL